MLALSTPSVQSSSKATGGPIICKSSSKNQNKRTRSVSPERTAKRPHLSLSRKLSYSSALREAQNSATTAHRSEAPPSPGFPSLLTVASSLASSLRTCSQHLGSTAVAYPPAEEDHLPGLPLDLHCTQRTPFVLRSAPLSRNAVPSSSSSSLPRRLETLRAASTSYDRSNTSQILEGDFLQPRPATSRISSTDSLEYRNMRACSEELPSSPMYEPQSACGLVAAVEDDAMDEDMAGVPDSRWSTEQMNPPFLPTQDHPDCSSPSQNTSHPFVRPRSHSMDDMSIPLVCPSKENACIVKSSQMASGLVSATSLTDRRQPRIKYSMGYKKGCSKCERGEKGHYTHIEHDWV